MFPLYVLLRRVLLVVATVGFMLSLVILNSRPVASADDAQPFQEGDVFAGVGQGKIKRFRPDGTLVQTLETQSGSDHQTGMCFDSVGNLYATNFDSGTMSKFSNVGHLIEHPWGGPFGDFPESCVLDSSGNIYTGEVDGDQQIRKWTPNGGLLDTYPAVTTDRGIDWIDLASDQCTMYYTSEGSTVKRYNVCTKQQLSDFATGLVRPCFALRLRPNGELMVTCRSKVYRISSSGAVLKTYDPGDGNLFAMNLDPDGTSFWTGGFSSGLIYHLDIETGDELGRFNVGIEGSSFSGIAVIGELSANLEDSDGDGLFDVWETKGLNVDDDEEIEVDLPAMGANPSKRDIFVEIDWMANDNHSHLPSPAAIQQIVEAFRNAPGGGINLHVDVGPESIDYVTGKKWGELGHGGQLGHVDILGNNDLITEINTIVDAHFDESRSQVFHYSIWGHQYKLGGGNNSSGVSFGNDYQVFLVTLGAFSGSTRQQAGTFMHELGHNLGLEHGGSDGINNKPNYLSVMNYLFQFDGLIINGRDGHYDYSSWDVPALNEHSLSESEGIRGGAAVDRYGTKYHVNFPNLCGLFGFAVSKTANGPVNWDCNIGVDEEPVEEDANGDGEISILQSYNDWEHVALKAGGIGKAGAPSDIRLPAEAIDTATDEITPVEAEQIPSVVTPIYMPVVAHIPYIPPALPLLNGDFEAGPANWTQSSSHNWPMIVNSDQVEGLPTHSGIWIAWLGGDDDETSTIEQTVTVPPDRPFLTYYHGIASEDACGYDFGRVLVDGAVVEQYTLCRNNNTPDWAYRVVNLSAYAGRTVALQFRATTDGSLNSNLLIDDVAFNNATTVRAAPAPFRWPAEMTR